MVTVVVFEFSVMRCQPLRRALGFRSNYEAVSLSGCINGYAQKKMAGGLFRKETISRL